MQQKIIDKKYITFLFLLIIIGGTLVFTNPVLSESCPSITTVAGTTVTFVGELTDGGGDSVTYVWFEYGETVNFGQKTFEKTLTTEQKYCINVSNLKPSTTYYYRAGARNLAGTSYGEVKSFTTTAGKTPIDLSVKQTIKNLTLGDKVWDSTIYASSSDLLLFRVEITSNNDKILRDLEVKNNLSSKINYLGDLKIDNISNLKDITSQAVNIGDLNPGQTKTITFKAQVAPKEQFTYGTTDLINTVIVYNVEISKTDTSKVIVKKFGVAGVGTGITDNILLNSLLFPLMISLGLVWVFRSELLGLDKLIEDRKRQIIEYRSQKLLRKKIEQMKKRIMN